MFVALYYSYPTEIVKASENSWKQNFVTSECSHLKGHDNNSNIYLTFRNLYSIYDYL